MTAPRLKAGIFVRALIRRAEVSGAMAAVVRKGAEESGAVFLQIRRGDGTYMVLDQARRGDGDLVWYRAKWSDLLDKDLPEGIDDAFVQRVVRAQTLYAIGAALCVFSTWWSIGFIVAVQLNYVIAPRFWPFNRL